MDSFTDFGSSERAMEKERKERQEAARKKRALERMADQRAKEENNIHLIILLNLNQT